MSHSKDVRLILVKYKIFKTALLCFEYIGMGK